MNPRIHRLLGLVHRWTGLTTAVFLVVAGLTGMALAFQHELDAILAPKLHRATTCAESERKDPLDLRDSLVARFPGAQVDWVPLHAEAGKSLGFWMTPAESSTIEDDEAFVDPCTGEFLGSRQWGSPWQGLKSVMPFLYRLHYSLALDRVGTVIMGIAALLWTFDCFTAFLLTVPVSSGGSSTGGRPLWKRWAKAWTMGGKQWFTLAFTGHRALGLWLWALLFVFAWSSVGFNLGKEVFRPVMSITLGMGPEPWDILPKRDDPLPAPPIGWDSARTLGEALVRREVEQRGGSWKTSTWLSYDTEKGLYRITGHSTLDVADRWGGTRLWFSGETGEPVVFDAPSEGKLGDLVADWLFALHMGGVWGLPYRILVAVVGLATALLSITGVWMWWRKRSLRKRSNPSSHPSTPSDPGVSP